ncbi:MAG: hypothetical protein V1855_04730 [bacterium]
MKKILSLPCMVIALLLLTSASSESSITNKTQSTYRSHGTNQALLDGAGITSIIHRKDTEKFGGFIQTIPWYMQGEMDATYWAPTNKNNFTFGTAGANTSTVNPAYTEVKTTDLDARLFVLKTRAATGTAESEVGKISFDPSQHAYGITMFYDQRLDAVIRGLFFTINLPFVCIQNNMNPQFLGTQGKILEDYFTGKTIAPSNAADPTDAQDPLTNALLTTPASLTGIADLDLQLGFMFLENKTSRASVHVGLTVPTGQQPTGKYVFDALAGNSRHFGFGGGLTLDLRLWGTPDQNITLHTAVVARYLLESAEGRTLGIKDVAYGHYRLLSPISYDATDANHPYKHQLNKALVPAANILTCNTLVTPRGLFDGTISLEYNYNNVALNVGYNLFLRQKESVILSGSNPLDGKKYALIQPNLTTNTENYRLEKVLDATDLDTTVATSPSQRSHKVYGSISYTFKEWDAHYFMSLGGHYEFADGKRGLEGWGINCRVGIGI